MLHLIFSKMMQFKIIWKINLLLNKRWHDANPHRFKPNHLLQAHFAFTNPRICIVNVLSFWLEILIQLIIKFIFKNLRNLCISSLRNLNLMLFSWLQVQEHYAKKIFPKAKKYFPNSFFSSTYNFLWSCNQCLLTKT